MPGAILAHLPVLDNLLPARFAVYVALCTALLFGVFVDSLPRTRGEHAACCWWRRVLVVAAFVPPLPFPTRAAATPAFFTASPAPLPAGTQRAGAALLPRLLLDAGDALAGGGGDVVRDARGLHHQRAPSGAAEQGPPPSATSTTLAAIAAGTLDAAPVSPDARPRSSRELRAWHVTAVVLGPSDQHGDALRAFLVDLLGAQPVDRDGVAVWNSVPAPPRRGRRDLAARVGGHPVV